MFNEILEGSAYVNYFRSSEHVMDSFPTDLRTIPMHYFPEDNRAN